MFEKTKLFVVAVVSAGVCVWTGCKDDDKPSTGGENDTTQPANCKAISDACHHVDLTGLGPIHDCHERAHDEPYDDSACAAVKEHCLEICNAAAADAGDAGDDDHDGH